MSATLETARTCLRPFRLEDAEAAFEWFRDPEVMRFMPVGPDADLETTRLRIRRCMDHQQAHGFSRWIIHARDSGKAIGDAGLLFMSDQTRVELGYRLHRNWWGQGIASEVAEKWLAVANARFGLREVFAFAHPDNAASLRIIRKVGFTFLQNEQVYGFSAPVYRWRAAGF